MAQLHRQEGEGRNCSSIRTSRTRFLFKKISELKRTFSAKMDVVKHQKRAAKEDLGPF